MSIQDELNTLADKVKASDPDDLMKMKESVDEFQRNHHLYPELCKVRPDDKTLIENGLSDWMRGLYRKYRVQKSEASDRVVSFMIDRVTPGGGYRDLSDVLKSKSKISVACESYLAELELLQARYDYLSAHSQIWRSVYAVLMSSKKPPASGKTRVASLAKL